MSIMLIVVLLFSALLISLAPAPSKGRKKIDAKTKKIYKLVTLVFILFYLLVYFITKDIYFSIPLWIIIFQSIQLTIMKGVNMYEKHVEKQITA